MRVDMIRKKMMNRFRDDSLMSYLERYDIKLPDIIGLICMSRSGSHFVLDSLHKHPKIGCLTESNLGLPLKFYFGRSLVSEKVVHKNFIVRNKKIRELDYIALNKPTMTDISYNFVFSRNKIRNILLFRNPVTLFISWMKGWEELGSRDHHAKPEWFNVLSFLSNQLAWLLRSFLDCYNPDRDFIISLESFTLHRDSYMKRLADFLKIDPWEIESRSLAKNLSAGGYDFERVVDHVELRKWKQHPEGYHLFYEFCKLFGERFMSYYEDCHYEEIKSIEDFENNILKFRETGIRVPNELRLSRI